MNDFSQHGYREMLLVLRVAGYSFRKFREPDLVEEQDAQLFLRHDVDFSLQSALQMANLEHAEDIQSTYFIQLRSPLYNALSRFSSELIRELHRLGHDIALHIDLGLYGGKCVSGLKDEIELLISHFPFANTGMVSFHRPRHLGLAMEKLRDLHFPHARHTYERRFFEEIEYISDSTRIWRYGHPLKSEAFRLRKSMQLVIHPSWWMISGQTPSEKFGGLIAERRAETIAFLKETVSFEFDLG